MNIRQNLVFSALISILVTLAVGGIGLTGMNIAASGVDRVSVIADAIRHHMQADMMHDALRGDVLLGLKASAEGNIVAVTEAADLVQSHSAEFKARLDSLKLPKYEALILYSTDDTQARDATKHLYENGYQGALTLKGGFDAWRAAGMGLVKPRQP